MGSIFPETKRERLSEEKRLYKKSAVFVNKRDFQIYLIFQADLHQNRNQNKSTIFDTEALKSSFPLLYQG